MNMRLLSWVLGGALLASTSLNALQWSVACGAVPPAVPASDTHLPDVALSDDQVREISSRCEACVGERTGLAVAMTDKEQELRAALSAPSPDAARCRELARQLGQLRSQCVQNSIESILLVRSVLTPEQVAAMVRCFESYCEAPPRR